MIELLVLIFSIALLNLCVLLDTWRHARRLGHAQRAQQRQRSLDRIRGSR